MPTKLRREDAFIEAFLSAYEDLTWADAEKDWVDRRIDGAVEMLAKRKCDGKTLAIEHTIAQPFLGEIEDYYKFFAPAFLQIENDKSLVVPNRWIQVFIPPRTLEGHRKPAVRAIIVHAVHKWIRDNRLKLPYGQAENLCRVAGVPGAPDLEIVITTKVTALPNGGSLHVRRQQVKNDFAEVIQTVLEKKLPKLVAQRADKHLLILERQHMNLVPEQILDEVEAQRRSFPLLSEVDEIWILETIGYLPGGYFHFELLKDGNYLASLTFNGGVCIGRSKDGMPIL